MTPAELAAALKTVEEIRSAVRHLEDAEDAAERAYLPHTANELTNVRRILSTSARRLAENLETV